MVRGLLAPSLWIVANAALAGSPAAPHGIQVLANSDCVIDNRARVPCGGVVKALRRAHASRAASIILVVDGARYETVIETRRDLIGAGFRAVNIMPPAIEGTIPSTSIRKWMRMAVRCSEVNHPLPMILVSTERFETWLEHHIVLSPEDYRVVSAQVRDAMEKPECSALPEDWATNPYDCILALEHHVDDDSRRCTLPKSAAVALISNLMSTPKITWSPRDFSMLDVTRAEVEFGGPKPLPAASGSSAR